MSIKVIQWPNGNVSLKGRFWGEVITPNLIESRASLYRGLSDRAIKKQTPDPYKEVAEKLEAILERHNDQADQTRT